MGKTEQAKYNLLQSPDAIELRMYEPRLVAITAIGGDRKRALKGGFDILAKYIFGDNLPPQGIIALQGKHANRKIAMTAPVEQIDAGDSWRVTFTMPREYTAATLPRPANDDVKIEQMPAQKVVAIRFSWYATDTSLEKHKKMLDAFVARNNLKTKGEAFYAYYNPPWTLPWNRRNEVLYLLAD